MVQMMTGKDIVQLFCFRGKIIQWLIVSNQCEFSDPFVHLLGIGFMLL